MKKTFSILSVVFIIALLLCLVPTVAMAANVSENTTELIKCIKETESQISRYREKRDSFGNKFMRSCDGHSSERVCRWILDEDTEER
jgi:hypothetical protein